MQSAAMGAIAVVAILLGYVLRHLSAKHEKSALLAQLQEAAAQQDAARAQLAAAQAEVVRLSGFPVLAQEREARIGQLNAEKQALEAERNATARERDELGRALAGAQERIVKEQEKYAQMKADLDAAFKGAASDALRANTQAFLTLAKQELGQQAGEAKLTLEQKEQAIKSLLQPLEQQLSKLEAQTQTLEVSREGAYKELFTLVEGIGKSIPESVVSLRHETAQLILALRAPKTRGNWGEMQLKRCVEFAGMVERCSFVEQATARTEEERLLRPDVLIHLPNGRVIVVDAKTPLDAFLEQTESDAAAQSLRFAAHAERVKAHVRELSGKAYWKQFEHTPEFVVCFLPSEALFSAALEADPGLIEFGSQLNVVMATPTTLIALLKAVAYGWQQSQVTENAKAIQAAGRDLYNKLAVAHEHFDKLGGALTNSLKHYNNLVGSVEGKGGAFFHARKLSALVHEPEVEALQTLSGEARPLLADDWTASEVQS